MYSPVADFGDGAVLKGKRKTIQCAILFFAFAILAIKYTFFAIEILVI